MQSIHGVAVLVLSVESPLVNVTVMEEKGSEQMAEKIESDRASTCSPPVQQQEQSPVEEQKEESH